MTIQAKLERADLSKINHAPAGFDAAAQFTPLLFRLLGDLHREFTPRQRNLVQKRRTVLERSLKGDKPDYLLQSDAVTGNWRIELPAYILDQRNQMTGPADDAELVVKMLNSGAPGVMIDLEDSMANTWEHLELGVENSLAALDGTLTYYDFKRDRRVPINSSASVAMIRLRGLHLNQGGVLGDEFVSASVFDAARIACGVDRRRLKHNLTFYIPKSESAEEACFWRDLFRAIEDRLGWERGYIKCFALVESHPFAFQMEEFLYNLRDHIVGLNLGRWDYMASLINFNLADHDWVLPDRNTIPTDVPFFQNLRELLVEICHRRGTLAIGGMTALYPSRIDPELNERALKVLEADKHNEAAVGMDGAWTGHPDQNAIAVAQFPVPNQIGYRKPDIAPYPDLRPIPKGIGKLTLAGTRAAVRTVIRYRNGVLNGKGASLLDGYMEDLATDRIYRLMIAQRLRHRDDVTIVDDDGTPAVHTPELITRLFDEELARLLAESTADQHETLREARRQSEQMIALERFDPV